MDNSEEYLLRVLRRTNQGLQDSLIPVHATKLSKLVDKIESSPALRDVVYRLQRVNGFGKCSLAMQWILERAQRVEEQFTPEQFESDILLMNEKLFEAFLNQPFDMPDYSFQEEAAAPARHIQQDVQVSDDELLLMGGGVAPTAEAAPTPEPEPAPLEEPTWSPSTTDTFAEALLNASETLSTDNSSPALSEVMNPDLFEATKNLAQAAVDFGMKTPNERPVAAAVMRVSAKSALETSKAANNLVSQDFFSAFVGLIGAGDKEGKIRTDLFADIIHDVGDRLNNALGDTSNGVNVLKSLTTFMQDPKELFKKG